MAAHAHKGTSDTFIQTLQAQMDEPRLTRSRPLSSGEIRYAFSRRAGGMADPSTIVSLTCSAGHTITDARVILACAALRLRHPLFASHVTFIGTPYFVVNNPSTQAHALRAAAAQVEFHTFTDQDGAVLRLRDEWLAVDPEKALDIRERTCAVWWGRDADPQSGRYVLGLLTTHFVTDQRRLINLVRHFLEFLARPAEAQGILDAHIPGGSPMPIPAPTEDLIPTSGDNDADDEEVKFSFNELYARFTDRSMSGIVPDGPLSAFAPRILRKVWNREETGRILQACKAHGVTITHLANIASALSAFSCDVSHVTAKGSGDHDTVYFDFSQPIDLAAKIQEHINGQVNGEMETAVRIRMYPVVLDVPHSTVADASRSPSAHVWTLAARFKEQNDAFVKSPHFWRFLTMYDILMVEAYKAKLAGRPALPFMSSLGDLKSLLPAHYAVQQAEHKDAHPNGHSVVAEGAEIHIADMWVTGRLDALALACHLFTFDGRLHLQLRYNASRTSPDMMEPWFVRVVEIIAHAAQR